MNQRIYINIYKCIISLLAHLTISFSVFLLSFVIQFPWLECTFTMCPLVRRLVELLVFWLICQLVGLSLFLKWAGNCTSMLLSDILFTRASFSLNLFTFPCSFIKIKLNYYESFRLDIFGNCSQQAVHNLGLASPFSPLHWFLRTNVEFHCGWDGFVEVF